MEKENQLSRYGAISRPVEVPFGAKLFLVSDSDDTTVGPGNLGSAFPVDKDGVARVYTTIQAAVNAASSNRGDVIQVLPGYDQSLTGADSWNTAGVTILGSGRGTSRSTLRYTGASGEVGIGASNVRVSGFRFLAAADSIARGIDIDSGFMGIQFDNNIVDFNAVTNDFRVMLRVGSPRSIIEDNRFVAEDTAGSGSAIRLKGGAGAFSTIRRNYFNGQFDTVGDTSNGSGVIVQDTTDTADTNFSGLQVVDNTIVSTDTAATMIFRLSAGYNHRGTVFGRNQMTTLDSTTADSSKLETPAEVRYFRNYIGGDSSEKLVGDSFVLAA